MEQAASGLPRTPDATERALEAALRVVAGADGDGRDAAPRDLATVKALVLAFVDTRQACGHSPDAVVVELKRVLVRAGVALGPSDDAESLGWRAVRWAIESYFR